MLGQPAECLEQYRVVYGPRAGRTNGGSRVLNIPYGAGVIASQYPISAITDSGLQLL